ncbi:Ig-like domain-containing protein [Bifidobacterium callimiconis]|uniref:Bacterial Ig-like domain, group 2 n=1 Tax=Bifidobacterium callimiconis TaxID=2306973 RepID=A0A430FIC9_9BIFI|nr:Ig-like domain-containing protein [Bifidobacterium callimiconis]RSX52643.1 bacterial Ig-like domain, group 2 [Bifidobacterium callimiconis]
MPAVMSQHTMQPPIMGGHTWNACIAGKLIWPTPATTVTNVTITTATGGPVPSTLPVNGSVALAAVATYGDGHTETFTESGVVWRSLDTGVAIMRGNTLVWRRGGTVRVTATVGGFTSPAVSVACAYVPESITVSPNPVTLRVGERVDLMVSVLPAGASQEVSVVSTDPDVVAVASASSTADEGTVDAALAGGPS